MEIPEQINGEPQSCTSTSMFGGNENYLAHAILIFSMLDRDDLEKCKRVNTLWKWLIEYGKDQLPLRELDAVVLSTKHEFSIKAYYKNRIKGYVIKKYYKDCDINGTEVKINQEIPESDINAFKFPCGQKILASVGSSTSFPPIDFFHTEACRPVKKYIYRNNAQANYTSKLFTPPLVFYERLQWLLKDCSTRNLVLHEFTMTDFFVEKMKEYLFSSRFPVQHLTIHSSSLRYINTNVFHEFLSRVVFAEKYTLQNIRNTRANHINGLLLNTEALLRSTFFYASDTCDNSSQRITTFNVTDEEILSFLEKALHEKIFRRTFFGIANSRVTPKVIDKYKNLYQRSEKKHFFFPHLLFGNNRYYVSKPAQVGETNLDSHQLMPPQHQNPFGHGLNRTRNLAVRRH